MKPKFYYSDSVGSPFPERIDKYWKITKPNVFVGLYDFRDFVALAKSKDKRYVYWCGGDILRLNKIKVWILKRFLAEHYCDNEVEQKALAKWNIEAKVRPAFFGNPEEYQISFKPSNKIHIYSVVRKGKEKEYGLPIIERMKKRFPNYIFHIYDGSVPEKQFDKEIKNYHCALRPNKWDGFSDVVCKSILMGQYPITRIWYPQIWNYVDEKGLIQRLEMLKIMKNPNIKGREYYLKNLNKFPFL